MFYVCKIDESTGSRFIVDTQDGSVEEVSGGTFEYYLTLPNLSIFDSGRAYPFVIKMSDDSFSIHSYEGLFNAVLRLSDDDIVLDSNLAQDIDIVASCILNKFNPYIRFDDCKLDTDTVDGKVVYLVILNTITVEGESGSQIFIRLNGNGDYIDVTNTHLEVGSACIGHYTVEIPD